MAELLFKKGLEESLPIASERTEGVFYVTEDTKKIVLGEAVWEDTNKVKEEIYSEIIKDEKVTAAALTELKEKKQNKLIAGKNITIENDVISVDADFDSSNFKINENYQTVEYPDTENEDVVFESIEVGQELGDAINTLEKNLVTLVAATIENEEIISTTLTQFDQEKVDYQTFDNAIEELNDKISNFDNTEGLDEALSEIREEVTNINNVIDTKLDIEAFSEAMASFEEDFETIDETVSNALTELHETVVDMTEIVEGKADVDHNHDDLYITEEVLESKGYITADDVEAPDLSGLATEEYVDNKVAALVNGAPETLDTLDELAAALKDNADIVTVLNDAISAKADKTELNDYSLTSHTHEEFTVIDITVANALTSLQEAVEDINTVVEELNNKADISDIPSLDGYATESWVEGKKYLTEHQDISHLATKAELSGYAESSHTHSEFITLQNNIDNKQDKINDLEAIINGAAKGATALQSIPEEYVTDAELTAKGYLTEHQSLNHLATKDELSGYSVTSHTHSQYLQSSDLSDYAKKSEVPSIAGLADKTYVDNKVAALVSGAPETLDTLDELAAALKDNADIVTVLENSIASKADKSELSGYSVTSHTHSQYLTEHQDISGKQDVINDLETIRSGAAKGATALQSVPSEYVTESELAAKGYLTEHQDISDLATKDELSDKQDEISDLATIRSNAFSGATAYGWGNHATVGYLTSVPSEYVTETELNGKGYLTSVPSEYVTETELSNALNGYVNTTDYNRFQTDVTTQLNTKANAFDLEQVATTGSYNDLKDKPSIPSEVTESTVTNWGFTKNTGTYSKPNGGIPKSDLASSVQTSLGKADTALQEVPDEYVKEVDLNETLKDFSRTGHTHEQYLTAHQDISGKQDVIEDLDDIRSGAEKGATAYSWGNHADAGYVKSASLEATLTDYVKVNDSDYANKSEVEEMINNAITNVLNTEL